MITESGVWVNDYTHLVLVPGAENEDAVPSVAQTTPSSTPHHLLILTARHELGTNVGRPQDHSVQGGIFSTVH